MAPGPSDAPSDEEETDADADGAVAVVDAVTGIQEPPRYAVILHNDDFSTMEFVVDVLARFFRRSAEEAARIMLKVHREGRGVAGVYAREIAEMKVAQVSEHARAHGHPLKCTAEPVL